MQPASSPAPLRIIGIDPGTRNVGYGVIEVRGNAFVFLTGGCIVADGDSIASRLVTIHRGLLDVIRHYRPGVAAVETVFCGASPKTGILIGEGRGVAVLSAAEEGLTVRGYEPSLVKRSVAASGRATKDQVRSMVTVLLALPELPATDHEADALALAITHARHCGAASGLPVPRRRSCRGSVAGPRRALPDFVLRQLPASMGGSRGA